MRDDEYETTIGTGGWILVVLSGLLAFGVLRGLVHAHLFPSVVFAVALALIVLLVLYWVAAKVSGEDADEDLRVRKIVPGSGEVRVGSGEGPSGAAVKAVPVRQETLKAQRPSSVVTPLAEVGPAPIIAAPAPAAPAMAEAAPADPVTLVSEPVAAKAAAKPKAKAAPKPKGEAKADSKPKTAAKPTAEAAKAAAKPKAEKAAAKPKAEKAEKPAGLVRLKAPRKGRADDLKEIEGIGPALEKTVNGLGFFHFDQIAQWTEADVALVDAEMKTFKGRITRDKWVEQAKIIATEGLEAFRERAKTNDY